MRTRGKLVGLVLLVSVVLVLGGSAASAGNYILHFQGRSQATWKSDPTGARMVVADIAGTTFVDKTFTFNGNARLTSTETDSTSNPGSVNYALRTYCGSGTGNTCLVHCY